MKSIRKLQDTHWKYVICNIAISNDKYKLIKDRRPIDCSMRIKGIYTKKDNIINM